MTFLRVHRSSWISIACLALVLAGCGDDDVMIGDDDAGGGREDGGPGPDTGTPGEDAGLPGEDAGPPPSDGGPVDAGPDGGGGEACGPVTCSVGQYCCNESCGICAAPGEGCITLACVDAGPPVDGGGPIVCGGFPGTPCPPGTFCDYRIEDICGAADATGTCEPTPGACPDVWAPVCGCDGTTYGNDCEAHMAGVAVASRGECGGTASCDPQDARGEGACAAFFGYYWNGSSCYGVSGCSCVGADCAGGGWPSPEECATAHGACAGGGTACGTRGGVICAPTEYCDYPDDACGSADVGGSCMARPGGCTGLFAPVCGCDGVTYSNDCAAASAGVDVDYAGECGAMADCRTTGCGPGETCQVCWLGYACIPEGAIC